MHDSRTVSDKPARVTVPDACDQTDADETQMMRMARVRSCALFGLIMAGLVMIEQIAFAEDYKQPVVSADLQSGRKTRISVFPFAFYSPEVDIAFGAGGIITFYTAEVPELRPSKLGLSAYYSTSNKYSVGLAPQAYFLSNRIFVSAQIFFQDKLIFSPDPEFPEIDAQVYGVGGELRIPALLGIDSRDDRRKLSLIVDYQHVELNFDAPNPAEDDPPHTLGVGAAWVWDSRDHIFYPHAGYLLRVEAVCFARDLGGSYDFNRYRIDARGYLPVNPDNRQVLAAQVYGEFVRGTPPFYRLAALGGSQLMRGYKSGSLRGRDYLAGQLEARSKLWRRLGAVAFLGMADIADAFSRMSLHGLEWSSGVGLRYMFNKSEQINLRADVAWGRNTDGINITVEEAF